MAEGLWVLVGALVGGLASAVGSVWAARRQHVYETRVEIYRVLLPSVWIDGPWEPKPPDVRSARWEELVRTGTALGGNDARHARVIDALVSDWRQKIWKSREPDGAGGFAIDRERASGADGTQIELRRVVSDYDQFLARRLGPVTRRLKLDP